MYSLGQIHFDEICHRSCHTPYVYIYTYIYIHVYLYSLGQVHLDEILLDLRWHANVTAWAAVRRVTHGAAFMPSVQIKFQVCTCPGVSSCAPVYMNLCMYAYTYIHVYIYTYIHTLTHRGAFMPSVQSTF